jgi:hypothetical protein
MRRITKILMVLLLMGCLVGLAIGLRTRVQPKLPASPEAAPLRGDREPAPQQLDLPAERTLSLKMLLEICENNRPYDPASCVSDALSQGYTIEEIRDVASPIVEGHIRISGKYGGQK